MDDHNKDRVKHNPLIIHFIFFLDKDFFERLVRF